MTRRYAILLLSGLVHRACGGTLRLTVHPMSERWLRYEVWCGRCGSCDPNGHGTLAEVVVEAPEYFGAKPPTGARR